MFVGVIVVPVCAFPSEDCLTRAGESDGDLVFAVEIFRAEAPGTHAFALHVVGDRVGPFPQVADIAANVGYSAGEDYVGHAFAAGLRELDVVDLEHYVLSTQGESRSWLAGVGA